MKNNGKSPTFKFVSGEERRPSEVQWVSRNWRLPGATHSSADLTWIWKWLEIQAPELSELEGVELELGSCCSDLDKQVSDEICRTWRDHLRSHFVFRPRHAPEWLRTQFLRVVFLANEEELTGNTFTTSLNTTNPNTYVKFIFLRTSPLTLANISCHIYKQKKKKLSVSMTRGPPETQISGQLYQCASWSQDTGHYNELHWLQYLHSPGKAFIWKKEKWEARGITKWKKWSSGLLGFEPGTLCFPGQRSSLQVTIRGEWSSNPTWSIGNIV